MEQWPWDNGLRKHNRREYAKAKKKSRQPPEERLSKEEQKIRKRKRIRLAKQKLKWLGSSNLVSQKIMDKWQWTGRGIGHNGLGRLLPVKEKRELSKPPKWQQSNPGIPPGITVQPPMQFCSSNPKNSDKPDITWPKHEPRVKTRQRFKCGLCKKTFQSKTPIQDHCQSKKHKERARALPGVEEEQLVTHRNPKAYLNDYCQKKHSRPPVYVTKKAQTEGYECTVYMGRHQVRSPEGRVYETKKQAKLAAANAAKEDIEQNDFIQNLLLKNISESETNDEVTQSDQQIIPNITFDHHIITITITITITLYVSSPTLVIDLCWSQIQTKP